MNKKGILIGSAIIGAIILAGCSQQQPMPQGPMASQSGHSSKLDKTGCTGHNCNSTHN